MPSRELDSPALIERFESYFRHPESSRQVLQLGDRTVAVKNLKTALAWLGFARSFGAEPDLYDEPLARAVQNFQERVKNRNVDGCVGPGTRAHLVTAVLRDFGASRFAQLEPSGAVRIPTVFLSYAWVDSDRVNKVDQWLRDHGVRVIRDVSSFKPGDNLSDSIWTSVLSADKVVAVYSKDSKTRDWPTFEHQIAERIESVLQVPVLVYLRLDDTPVKAHDPHRIAISAQGKVLRQVGAEIQKALGITAEADRFEYDENEPL